MRVIGVDFSGAGSDTHVGKTWIARGELVGNVLTIESCCPISRAALTGELAGLPEPAVVGMDFPFSVPKKFACCWAADIGTNVGTTPAFKAMPDLWAATTNTDWASAANKKRSKDSNAKQVPVAKVEWMAFRGLRDEFCKEHGALKRKYDPDGSYSPLKWDGNPNMVPMTFWGMRMLNALYPGPDGKPIWVPPLQCPQPKPHITFLEVMPGKTIGKLVGEEYSKGYKGGKNCWQNRKDILDKLPGCSEPGCSEIEVTIPDEIRGMCRANDDALDAVIAAITAALWDKDRSVKTLFCYPPEPGQPNYDKVQLEGWLYAPKKP